MISFGSDVPGFLCLDSENQSIALAQTGNFALKEIKGMNLISSNGSEVTIPEDVKDEKLIEFENSEVSFGDCLKPKSEFHQDNNSLSGWFASRYLIIHQLIDFINTARKDNMIFHFNAQSESRAEGEKNAALKFKPSVSIHINTVESDSEKILIAVRDGKNFSDEALMKLVETSEIPTKRICLETPVSKSILVSSCNGGTPTLTLILPVKNKNKFDETISVSVSEDLIRILDYLSDRL